MNKYVNRLWISCGVALALVPVLCSAAGEQIIKIGFSSPLTGGQSANGKDNLNGAKMAIDELNKNGLIIAGKKIQFELMAEDDQADPKSGMMAAQKMIDSGVKAVLGPYNSGVTIPASKLFNDAGIVMATVASSPKVTTQGFPFVYRISAHDSQLGAKMAEYAAKELKLKKVAVIDDRTTYGQGIAEEFAKAAKANGMEIVVKEFTNDKATDFNSILTSIKAKKTEGIFYGGLAPQATGIVRQMNQLGINTYLLGGAICDGEMGQLAQQNSKVVEDRVFCTQAGARLDSSVAGKAFSDKYQKLYNSQPMTYSVSFYDGMILLAEAMKKANSVEPKHYSRALDLIKYTGIAGTYEFDKKHDLKRSPATVYKFKNGELTAVASD